MRVSQSGNRGAVQRRGGLPTAARSPAPRVRQLLRPDGREVRLAAGAEGHPPSPPGVSPATSDRDARLLGRTFISAAEPSLMSTLDEALVHDFLNILLIPPPKAKG